jgi:hypothetical protein
MESPLDIISAPVKEFARISGLGESTIWAMVRDGRLKTFTVGRRRLVLVDSYRKLIEQQRDAPLADARRNECVPRLGSRGRGESPAVAGSPARKTRSIEVEHLGEAPVVPSTAPVTEKKSTNKRQGPLPWEDDNDLDDEIADHLG